MGLGIKTKITNYFREKVFDYFGPEIIRINPIGYACTNQCPMCWRTMNKINKKGGLLNTELQWQNYKKLLSDLPFTVSTIEVLGGGEPLLFPKIEALFKKIKAHKVSTLLITNGVLLNEKISKVLVKTKWDKIRISINAGSKEVYPQANGAYYFDRIVKNIEQLIKLRKNQSKPEIGLHYVIQKSNYQDIDNFIELANKLKIDFISFDTLIYDTAASLKLNNTEVTKLKKTLNQAIKQTKINNNIKIVLKKINQGNQTRKKSYFKNRYCQIVQNNLDISSEGAVVPCCMAYGENIAKNLKNKNIKTIWQEFAPFRKKLRNGEFQKFCYEKCNYPLNSQP